MANRKMKTRAASTQGNGGQKPRRPASGPRDPQKDRLMRRSDRYLAPGTAVRYDGLDVGGPEYGVVVHCWKSEEVHGYDCYVAFFGDRFPMGTPTRKPYVLRYFASSLRVILATGEARHASRRSKR